VKVTLGIVLANGFPVPAPFIIGYSHLLQMLMTGMGNRYVPNGQIDTARALFGQDFPIDWARNRLCQLFLDEDDGDYLLFLDADMKHPPLLAHKLVSHGVDVVTARYVTRRMPFFTVAMRKVGPGPMEYQAVEKLCEVKGLIPIDAGGAGALLISRETLEKIRARFGDDWFRYQDGADGLRNRSEDMWFYERCRDVGVQPYLDADLVCTHVASFEVDPSWQNPELVAEVAERAKAIQEREYFEPPHEAGVEA
jgi:glycosyltransferase involved in cell wall biosynthesis